jgi:hypothetical protein
MSVPHLSENSAEAFFTGSTLPAATSAIQQHPGHYDPVAQLIAIMLVSRNPS